MKKLLISLTILMFSICYTVSADNVAKATQKVMTKFNVAVTDDTGILRFYENYNMIKSEYKPLMASAIKAGLLRPVNGVIQPESNDLTSVKNGLISYGLKNINYKIISGKYSENQVAGAIIGNDTLLLDEMVEGGTYTVIVDKLNNAVAVWVPTKVVQPTVYRAKMYIKVNNTMVVYDLERSAFDLWIKEKEDKLIELNLDGTNMQDVSDDYINEKYMDKTVYFYADAYNGKIIPLCIEGVE